MCPNCCYVEIKHIYLRCYNRFMPPRCMAPLTLTVENNTVYHSNIGVHIVVVLKLGTSILRDLVDLCFLHAWRLLIMR